ncbi:hypothetical protein M408DRAFT_194127 [Serendipita vermifera MAFF 305830]|uniref:Uncharacterized protein n=1 Tax=Serendipita vermifera MAFF 305830 TaxID=933852 RepID=A0A0C3ANS8_SERVB|nr:hypothetical protein M408DRAFT_194127 [Serendipita vermifera MAFF 305830]
MERDSMPRDAVRPRPKRLLRSLLIFVFPIKAAFEPPTSGGRTRGHYTDELPAEFNKTLPTSAIRVNSGIKGAGLCSDNDQPLGLEIKGADPDSIWVWRSKALTLNNDQISGAAAIHCRR